MEYLFAFA